MMMWMSDDGVWPSCRQGVVVVLRKCAQKEGISVQCDCYEKRKVSMGIKCSLSDGHAVSVRMRGACCALIEREYQERSIGMCAGIIVDDKQPIKVSEQ